MELTIQGVDYKYSVRIGSSILKNQLSAILSACREKSIYLLTNETVYRLYRNLIGDSIPAGIRSHSFVLPDGEKYKNIGGITRIYDFLLRNEASRNDLLIAFGGGVIGDMGGFAAATFMRGIPYIQVPTTLLSQVDSGIGGKTGVNHTRGKNLIGAFKQPLATIADIDFLQTLPPREFDAGYAELIKHGLIRDRRLFEMLEGISCRDLSENKPLLEDAIYRSCKVKAHVVERDEKEHGIRSLLNFGHTIGHFIETYTDYRKYLHGEAVVVGMDFAAWWSMNRGEIDESEYLAVRDHLRRLGIKVRITDLDRSSFLSIVGHDKKATRSGIRFIGLKGIGEGAVFAGVPLEELWTDFRNYATGEFSLISAI